MKVFPLNARQQSIFIRFSYILSFSDNLNLLIIKMTLSGLICSYKIFHTKNHIWNFAIFIGSIIQLVLRDTSFEVMMHYPIIFMRPAVGNDSYTIFHYSLIDSCSQDILEFLTHSS